MELKKLNEVYSITDVTEAGWNTQGQVVIETSGAININFSTRTRIEPEYIHIGGANYVVPAEEGAHINSSFSCSKEYIDEYRDYTEKMVEEILDFLKLSK
jgi:hypothetical protein